VLLCTPTGSRAFPSDAAQRPAESAQGQLEPISLSGHMAHPSMLEAQHDSASNLHSPVPSFMASLLPQVSQSALAVQVVVLVFQRISTDRPAHLLHTLHVCCERLVSCNTVDHVLYVQRGNDDYLGSLAEQSAVKHQLWCRLSSRKTHVGIMLSRPQGPSTCQRKHARQHPVNVQLSIAISVVLPMSQHGCLLFRICHLLHQCSAGINPLPPLNHP